MLREWIRTPTKRRKPNSAKHPAKYQRRISALHRRCNGSDLLGLRKRLEQFVTEQWLPAHVTRDEAEAIRAWSEKDDKVDELATGDDSIVANAVRQSAIRCSGIQTFQLLEMVLPKESCTQQVILLLLRGIPICPSAGVDSTICGGHASM